MNRRQLLTAAAAPLLLRPMMNAVTSEASAQTPKRVDGMSEPTQRIIEANGIHLNIAEKGSGQIVD